MCVACIFDISRDLSVTELHVYLIPIIGKCTGWSFTLLNKVNRLCICNVIRSAVESTCSMKGGLRGGDRDSCFFWFSPRFLFSSHIPAVPPRRFFSSTIESRFLSLAGTKSPGTSLIRETKAGRLKFVYCSPVASIEFDVILSITTIRPGEVYSRFPPDALFHLSFLSVRVSFFFLKP